ncbi:MAG TPA: hypothetical protein ENI15_21040 [Spirochaetes bacterium]|nr:hypothetical protein [Spirochaetota bacterium]
MKFLIVINDAPYGTEKAYNAFRLAIALQSQLPDAGLHIFLMADAVTCALPAQSTPNGFYNIERMIIAIIRSGAQVKACGSCCSARGIENINLVNGVEMSTITQLAQWTVEADKILTF